MLLWVLGLGLIAGAAIGAYAVESTHRRNTKVSTPSASHNRQITKSASCEACQYDYASIMCSTCGVWITNKGGRLRKFAEPLVEINCRPFWRRR